jgi:hypothetical protein
MKSNESSLDNYSCEYCNQIVSKHFKKLQLAPDASHWIKLGSCGVLCSGKIGKGTDEEKKILEKITAKTIEILETKNRRKE